MSALAVHPNAAMYTSPEFIIELALGKDPEAAVCARHGVEPADMAWLNSQPWFVETVVRKRLELHENGFLFGAKSEMMLEELVVLQYKSAITGNLNGALTNDLIKLLADITGKRGPGSQAQAGPAGPAFQLNINVTADTLAKGRAGPVTIDAVAVEKPLMSIPLGDPLPPRPAGFRVPDFKLTPDLIGTPAAQQAAAANSTAVAPGAFPR